MDRIYHPYWKWEDYRQGFYNNVSGKEKETLKNKVVEMFRDPVKTKKNMNLVIKDWVYSCEHNLTNQSMNKIAYIGQAACCIYAGVPSSLTMEAWRLVSEENKKEANKTAEEILNKWINNQKNKQLCLKLD